KPKVKSVWASMNTHVHADKTRGEDHSLCVVEYEGGQVGLAENSWAKQGGVDDRCEIYGSAGFTRADLLRGRAPLTYSERGYGYAVEKAASTKGYTFTMFEEVWNYGSPQGAGLRKKASGPPRPAPARAGRAGPGAAGGRRPGGRGSTAAPPRPGRAGW